ncbi:MAG: shikimate dehydrogenase [Thermoguttaceae bacterium]
MICVSIGRGRHRHVIAEHRHLVQQGAKLVELRVDYIDGEANIKRLVADRPCPVIITCRRTADGGKFAGSEDQRLMLLRTAIAEGVEYVDLEEDIAAKIPRFGQSKRIISHHDFRKTPDNLEEIHRRLGGLDADIIKICTMANHPRDNLRMLQLSRQSKIPTVGVCMGDIGAPTRILGGRFGSPLSFATFHHERALAPGQLSFQQMTEVYHYDQIDAQTEVYGVVADPVGHSLSPLVHNAAFAHLKLNKVYIPFRVPREDLAQFIEDAPAWGIRGLSVTIPHKEEIIKMLTEADGTVQGIGAANTVVFHGDDRSGYNTDYRAAMSSLEVAVDAGGEEKHQLLKGKTALVLGAGGAGKAISYGLCRRGAEVIVADLVARQANLLAKRLNCRSVDWSLRHNVTADVLINCTPVGMHPNVDESPYDKHYLRPSMVVFDVVYNPENTLLVKEARNRNCTVVTGVDMFVRQACLQFKLFTGQDGPAELMREVIRRAIGAAKN